MQYCVSPNELYQKGRCRRLAKRLPVQLSPSPAIIGPKTLRTNSGASAGTGGLIVNIGKTIGVRS